jgi:tetratricopeptide (TPR) repeat protein
VGLTLPLSVWGETDWYTLKTNGQIIGKVGIHSYPAPGNQAGTVTEVSHVNHFTRQGSPFEVNSLSRFVESPDAHKALSFSYRYDLGEQQLLEAHGQLNNNTLDMRLLRENTETIGQAPTGEQFMFPGGEGIKQVYRQHYQDKPGERFTYQTLHLGVQPQVVNTAVKTLRREKLALATGESKPVRKFELSNATHTDQKIYEWRDAEGKLYKSQTLGMGGMEMVYASQRQVQAIDQRTIDLVSTSAVLTTIIPQARISNEALYKLSPITGQTLDLKAEFPESFTQKWVKGSGNEPSSTLYLQVNSKAPSNALATFPVPFDRDFLKATPYLQVSDPQLNEITLKVVGKEKRAYYAARKLQQWVYQNIAYKDLTLGFSSAQETLQRKQGDCTEHAVLLAAMLRALGIPSRVAIGLIYLPDSSSQLGKFVFHMWTEAYIGNSEKGDWLPLDATNPELLTDATHIKLADSKLSAPDDLIHLTHRVAHIMGKIRLDVVKALSPTQSILSIAIKTGPTALKVPKLDIHHTDVQALSKQAIKHFRVNLSPSSLSADSADGLFTTGIVAQSKGLSTEAKQAFTQSLAKVSHPIALYQMGERLLAVGQYSLAKQAFTQAKTKDETLAPLVANWMNSGIPTIELSSPLTARFEQAMAQRYQGALTSACEQFQSLTRQNIGPFFPAYRGVGESCSGPEAVQAFKMALSINPDAFESAESMGDFFLENQRFGEAAQAYQTALNSLTGKPFTQSKPWISSLKAKLEIATGAARLSRNQKNAEGWLHVGKGLALQQRNEDARQAFENTLIIEPSHSEAFVYRYQIALKQFDWPYLQANQSRLETISSNHSLAARLLADYKMRTRQYSPALNFAQRSIGLNPAHGEAYETLFQIYERMADQALWKKTQSGSQNASLYWRRAERALKQGLIATHNPIDSLSLKLALGTYLIEKNRVDEALAYAHQIQTENPISGRGHWLRGKALFFAGKHQEAQAALKTALLLLPNDPDTLTALGQIAEEEGRQAQAMDYYQQAYKADTSAYEASQALRRLMEKLRVTGKKPPAYVQLSPDEHDYLVQMGVLNIQIQNANLAMNQAKLDLLAKGNQFTLNRLEHLKKNIALMQTAHGTQLHLYRQVENLQAPPQFTTLHFNYLQTHRHLLNLLNESIAQQGVFTESQYSNMRPAILLKDLQMVEGQNHLNQVLQQTLDQLPAFQARDISLEAGWNPQAFEAELQETAQQLSALKDATLPQQAQQPASSPKTP